jgi:putative transposase
MVMSTSTLQPDEYLNFLIASPRQVTGSEAARCQAELPNAHAHDAFTRLLHRLEPDAKTLWEEARLYVQLPQGVLILDDSVLDKPYARKMDLVGYVWSGKHHRVVRGIDLITLLWSDGPWHVPCDYRVYDKADGLTKNDHFRAMLLTAKERGFQPQCVLFDSWYASLENLKLIREQGWHWLTRLKANRRVNLNRTGLKSLGELDISATGTIAWLQGYGEIKVFLIVSPDGDKQYWATDNLELTEVERAGLAHQSWKIEEYHRGLKQVTNIERCQMRSARAQRNHILFALRAFLRFETHYLQTGIHWLQAKWQITRSAVTQYLQNPTYLLANHASA